MPTETLRQIAAANPLVEIVGVDVPLKKTGAVLVGSCPFHQERTPSFTVTPARGRFHCFGCGAGGDVFAYVMMRTDKGFLDAATFLARRAGIALAQSSPRTAASHRLTSPHAG